jgi:hypothetical protein
MQEDTAPTLRTQVCAVTHLESRLDAEEEEMGVSDAKEITRGELDRGLKCDRENDRRGNGQPSMCSSQTQLKQCYTRSGANRLENQPDPEGESRRMLPMI